MTTPPTSTLALVPGTFASRFIARAIDALVVAAIDLLMGTVLGFGYDWLVLGALIVLAYFVLLDALVGTTAGKAAMKLRIVAADGGRPSLASALRRESFMLVGSIPFIGPILALGIWIWFSMRIRADALGQGPHDHFAGGTRVVRA